MASPFVIVAAAWGLSQLFGKKTAAPVTQPPKAPTVPVSVTRPGASLAIQSYVASQVAPAATLRVDSAQSGIMGVKSAYDTALAVTSPASIAATIGTELLIGAEAGPVGWVVAALVVLSEVIAFLLTLLTARTPSDLWWAAASRGGFQFVHDALSTRIAVTEQGIFISMLMGLRKVRAADGSYPYANLTWTYSSPSAALPTDLFDARVSNGYVQPPNPGYVNHIWNPTPGQSLEAPVALLTQMYIKARALAVQEAYFFNRTMFNFFSSLGLSMQAIGEAGAAYDDATFWDFVSQWSNANSKLSMAISSTSNTTQIPPVDFASAINSISSDPNGASLLALVQFMGRATAAAMCAAHGWWVGAYWPGDQAFVATLAQKCGLPNWCQTPVTMHPYLVDPATLLGLEAIASRDQQQLVIGCVDHVAHPQCNPIDPSCGAIAATSTSSADCAAVVARGKPAIGAPGGAQYSACYYQLYGTMPP